MQKAEDRIKFAVDLATKNFDLLRAGDRLNLKEELGVFLHGGKGFPQTRDSLGGVIVSAIERPLAQDYTPEDFLELQQQIRRLLIPIALSASAKNAAGARVQAIQPVDIVVNWAVVPAGNQAEIVASGSVRDCFLTRLLFLLAGRPPGKILICPACTSIFFKDGKMLYCSRRCANRMAARRFQKQKTAQNSRKAQPPSNRGLGVRLRSGVRKWTRKQREASSGS